MGIHSKNTSNQNEIPLASKKLLYEFPLVQMIEYELNQPFPEKVGENFGPSPTREVETGHESKLS